MSVLENSLLQLQTRNALCALEPIQNKSRIKVDFQERDASPKTILRLTEVLRLTGLSRSTLYNRIAQGEFPHQVSIGGRAVGWPKCEVEDWINDRISLRPGSPNWNSERASAEGFANPKGTPSRRPGSQRFTKPTSCIVSVSDSAPDPAELHLVGTRIYFDKSTGCFWLKLTAEYEVLS
jgi:prophage regulatory protein